LLSESYREVWRGWEDGSQRSGAKVEGELKLEGWW
jgi:hypothetical protein